MKRCRVPLPISVSPPTVAERFARSRGGAFVLGFFLASFTAGILAGVFHWPN